MASTYSAALRLELMGNGDQSGTWGTTTNTNLGTLVETAIAGYTTVSVTAAAQALTANNGTADQARSLMLKLTTTTTAPFAVYAPPANKAYVVYNASAYAATVYNSTTVGNTTAAGTGAVVPAGATMLVITDGTNFVTGVNYMPSLTLGAPLPVASGGTGASTSATARTALGAAASGANTDITALSSVTSMNGGPLAGFRNRVINGGMAVDQRNNGSAGSLASIATANAVYTVDRMIAFATGTTTPALNYQRIDSGTGPFSLRLTSTNSNTGAVGIAHRIEQANTTDMYFQNVVFSLQLATNNSSTVTWTAYQPNTKDVWNATSMTSGTTGVASGTFSTTASLTGYSASFNMAGASALGVEIVFSVANAASGQTIEARNLQFELGTVATAFEANRPYGMELALCQRYLPVLVTNASSQGLGNAAFYTSTLVLWAYQFKVTPRVPPASITVSAVNVFTFIANGTSYVSTAIVYASAGYDACELQITTNAAVANAAALVRSTGAILILFNGCEL